MTTLTEKMAEKDYTVRALNETGTLSKSSKKREIITVLTANDIPLPTADMKYIMFDKHDNMLDITYVLSTDSYYIAVSDKAAE